MANVTMSLVFNYSGESAVPFQINTPFNDYVVLKRKVFVITHVVIPFLLLGFLFVGLELSGLDLLLSTQFYNPEKHQWPYKDHWLTQKVLHKGGRIVFFAIVSIFLCLFLWSFKPDTALKTYRSHLGYLFLASICGPIIIMNLKDHTYIYCPWDLQLFGGAKPYLRWFDPIPATMPVGHCFPAAHAGSGFTFVSLYFFCLTTFNRYKYYGLSFGLALGVLYGITQQMRGAHFLSHDVMSLGICWFVSLSIFIVFFRKKIPIS